MPSWFKNKGPEIPLPPSSSPNVLSKPQPGRQTYNPSRDGDPYAAAPSSYAPSGRSVSPAPPSYATNDDPYSRRGIGDPYSRAGAGNADADRAALFGGYNPETAKAKGNRFDDRSTGGGLGGNRSWQDRDPQNQQEEEEDVDTIKADTRQLKNESVNSTRNALRLAREAEETARGTLEMLGDQSGRLANAERLLDQSKGYTTRAEDRTKEIKVLNKSIFNPRAALMLNKDSKRAKEEARMAARHEAEEEERTRTMMDVRDTENRIGRATTYGMKSDTYGDEDSGSTGMYQKQRTAAQTASRSRFQFEKTESDDELEDELDGNLDDIGDVTKRLKALAMAQGEEVQRQNDRLNRMNENANQLDNQLGRATRNLKRL